MRLIRKAELNYSLFGAFSYQVFLQRLLTWTGAVMSLGIPDEAWSTAVAPGPGGVSAASQAVSRVRVANLGRALGVCVPVTLTSDTILG